MKKIMLKKGEKSVMSDEWNRKHTKIFSIILATNFWLGFLHHLREHVVRAYAGE